MVIGTMIQSRCPSCHTSKSINASNKQHQYHRQTAAAAFDFRLTNQSTCKWKVSGEPCKVGVHRIQNFAIRLDPDPYRILTLDPKRILVTWIWSDPDPNLYYCRQQEKNYSFCTTTGKAGMTVYLIL